MNNTDINVRFIMYKYTYIPNIYIIVEAWFLIDTLIR